MALINTQHLTRSFGEKDSQTVALRDINISVDEGEFVAIMGQSGSGKSTLLHILGFLDRPSSGQYLFDGKDSTSLTDDELAHVRNTRLGFVFQAFYLLPRVTVLQNVMMPLSYSHVLEKQHKELAYEALKQVELTHRLDHEPSELSGGEKQRVAIARALVNKPKIIFADEPTGNLDSKTGKTIMDVLKTLHQSGQTIILITHEHSTARYAKRIVTLHDGLVASDTPVAESIVEYQK